MSLILDEHRTYLADSPRLEAFERAICQVVRSGDVVLDLGCGTGILGMLACRAGARRVYAVEETALVELAREIGQANGLRDRIVFVKALSTRLTLPEKVDVVVADQIGRFGFDAGVLEYFADARDRLLAPGGRLIPRTIDFHLAPVESAELRGRLDFWAQPRAGFHFTPASEIALNTAYGTKLDSAELLGEPATAGTVDMCQYLPSPIELVASLEVRRPGGLDGVGGWFSAGLAEGVAITNSPLSAGRVNRSNLFLPIAKRVQVQPGDRVRVKLTLFPRDVMISWILDVVERGESGPSRTFRHSTFKGMLLCSEDVARTRPEFVPRLDAWGEARRAVVNLCDGARTVAEIEEETARRHPALFPTRSAAAGFVAEVVTRYSR